MPGKLVFGSVGGCFLDIEDPVQHGNLQKADDFLVHVDQRDFPSVFLHFPVRDQECAQPAAITEFNVFEIDDEAINFRLAEDEELAFDQRRQRRIQLPLLQLEGG